MTNKDLFKNIDKIVKTIMGDVTRKIEEQYNIPNDMVSVIIPNYNNEFFLNICRH